MNILYINVSNCTAIIDINRISRKAHCLKHYAEKHWVQKSMPLIMLSRSISVRYFQDISSSWKSCTNLAKDLAVKLSSLIGTTSSPFMALEYRQRVHVWCDIVYLSYEFSPTIDSYYEMESLNKYESISLVCFLL